MLILKPLSYSSCVLAILVSISLFALPPVNAYTCSNVQIKPQPLAIDFASKLLYVLSHFSICDAYIALP